MIATTASHPHAASELMHSGKYMSFSMHTPTLPPRVKNSPMSAPLLYFSPPKTRVMSHMPKSLPLSATAADLRTAPREYVVHPHTAQQPCVRERRAASSSFSLLPESSSP